MSPVILLHFTFYGKVALQAHSSDSFLLNILEGSGDEQQVDRCLGVVRRLGPTRLGAGLLEMWQAVCLCPRPQQKGEMGRDCGVTVVGVS